MFHVIVNPSSSSGRGKSKWDKIEERFKMSGASYKVHFSSPSHSIEDICEELTSSGDDVNLVILGGDGTMNAVVNGIRDFEHTRVGFIQTGSGNDLIKGLGIRKKTDMLIDSILKGEVVRTCDIGRVTFHNRIDLLDPFTHRPIAPSAAGSAGSPASGVSSPSAKTAEETPAELTGEYPVTRLFNISTGIGFDAAVCETADTSPFKSILNKIRMGKLIYITEAIHMILASPMVTMKIECDGVSKLYPRTLFAVVMNTCFEGGGFKFCPDAVSSDGILDLFGANDLHRMNFFRIFPTAYSGNHLKFKGLFTDKGKKISIRSTTPLWVHTDGEVSCKSSHITVDLYPQKLQLLI